MRIVFFVLLTLWASLARAQALPGTDPYEARIPVDDQSAAARDTALREALRTVVERVSGDAFAAGALIDQASQLVQRYGYERDAEGGGLLLVAAFDSRALDGRLRAAGLPVWGVYAAEVEELQLQVSGIDGAEAYVRVLSTLSGLPGVRGVKPVRASGDRLELRVRAEGGAGRLSGALLAAGTLARDPYGEGELSYRYLR